ADQRRPEDIPVKADGAIEIRHGNAAMAERPGSHRDVPRMWSATRSAWATMVRPGLTAPDEGKNDASTTNRFSTSCARQNESSTEVRGSVPKQSVPHWCVVFFAPAECTNAVGDQ